MNCRKLLTIWLAAMLLLQMAGCGSRDAAETGGSADTEAVQEADKEFTLKDAAALFADREYGGYDFRVCCRNPESKWSPVDITAEEMTGETINDSVYNRNAALTEAMNIRISQLPADSPTDSLKNSVLSGTGDMDAINEGVRYLAACATENMLLDYRNIDTVNGNAPYWDTKMYEEFTVLNKSFFLTGDISISDNWGTWCLIFNKDLVTDNSLEDPYTLVHEGKWTIDKMQEMASAVQRDADGDGQWTPEADIFGLLTENYNSVAFWCSMGFRIVEKDGDGLPYYSYTAEEAVSALQRAVALQYSDCSVLGLGFNDSFPRGTVFSEGRGLFRYSGMINIQAQRDSEEDFGVLPAPKYNESQEEYHSSFSVYNLTAYSIPSVVTDAGMAGDILEALAHTSLYSLTPAYYDQTLIGKSIRDEESEPMIDLILRTRNYDLGMVYLGDMLSAFNKIKDPGAVSSALASASSMAEKLLEELITSINAIEQ